MTNCILTGNSAVGTNGTAGADGNGGTTAQNGGNGTAGGPALGGAIYNLGSLTAIDCQFLTNSATGGSGGAGGAGGNGWHVTRAAMAEAAVPGGSACGGAIYNLGTLSLTQLHLSGNTCERWQRRSGGARAARAFLREARAAAAPAASGSGAAVYSAQSFTAVNCTFSGNVAQRGNSAARWHRLHRQRGVNGSRGRGQSGWRHLQPQGKGASRTALLLPTWVTGGNGGNGGTGTAKLAFTAGNGGSGGNGIGGGLYNTGAVTVVNCTFSGCGPSVARTAWLAADPSPARLARPALGAAGILPRAQAAFVLRNTILAASSAGTNAYDTSASRITDGGYNISSDASLNLSGTSRKNTDPKLGSLADNGGPTQTMAIQSNSPAINKIPQASSPATDQRGIPRPQPQGGLSDIGAYELVTLPAILTQPQSQTNIINTSVIFTVSAFGGSLGYQWRFNDEELPGATDANYTIDSAVTDRRRQLRRRYHQQLRFGHQRAGEPDDSFPADHHRPADQPVRASGEQCHVYGGGHRSGTFGLPMAVQRH